MQDEVSKKISKAKMKLLIMPQQAFLSTIVLGLETIISEKVQSVQTDGLSISYNPDFVMNTSDDDLLYAIAQQAYHVALQHMLRMQGRNPEKWERATDYVVNETLSQSGFNMMQGSLLDEQYFKKSAEEVYELLEDDPNQQEQQNPIQGDLAAPGSNSQGDGDSDGDGDGNGNGQPQMSEEDVKQAIEEKIISAAQAAQMSNQAGSVPAHIQRMLDELLNPRLPWQTVLQQYMSAKAKTEKSWSRRNKRFKQVYMPSKLGESMGNVNIYVDASGSVSQEEFSAYITEMHDIRETLKPEVMKVIAFDTSIKEEFVMNKGEEIDVNFQGGGGTCTQCVINHAEQEEEVDVSIIFTDGYFSERDYSNIPNDVLFVIVNNENWKPPQGTTAIYMDF